MSDHTRIALAALAALAVLLWALYAGMSRAQTLEDFLILAEARTCPTHDCPRPPLPSVCGSEAFEVRLQAIEPEAVTAVRLACGQRLNGEVLDPCARVTAWNERDELTSEVVARDYPADGCVPVPEPSFGVSLMMMGALLLGGGRPLSGA